MFDLIKAKYSTILLFEKIEFDRKN
jgi:hypothetical protein